MFIKIGILRGMKSLTKKLVVKSLPLFLAVSMTSCFWINNNLHTLKKDYVYRSAQMNYSELERTIKKYDIKTIINLRGWREGKKWYEEEIAVCKKYNVKHHDIKFSTRRLPRKKDVLEFFEVLDTAEYPLLIHCQAGADRTGCGGLSYTNFNMKGKH